MNRFNYKALLCNCLGSLELMTQSEPSSKEYELLRKKWKQDGDWLITSPAVKYSCPNCKTELIGIDARENENHEN